MELSERESTIRDKDSRIFDLKKKTQELEKFKFVLDYKIKELKRDICPREDEIKDLLQLTNTMQQEVQHFTKVNQNLGLIVEDLRMRQSGLINEKKKLEQLIEEQKAFQNQFCHDVWEVVKQIDHHKKLKVALVDLYKQYVLQQGSPSKNGGEGMQVNKERDFQEEKVKHIKEQQMKSTKEHKDQKKSLMKHNVQLLEEINNLTKQKHEKTMQISMLQAENPQP